MVNTQTVKAPTWRLELGSGISITGSCSCCDPVAQRLCGRCTQEIWSWLMDVGGRLVWEVLDA